MSEPVVLGPGDRPWDARDYGRMRVNEALAGEMMLIFTETLDLLHERRMSLKEDGMPATEINRRIRRTSVLRNLLHGMMHEKGWCSCDEG